MEKARETKGWSTRRFNVCVADPGAMSTDGAAPRQVGEPMYRSADDPWLGGRAEKSSEGTARIKGEG